MGKSVGNILGMTAGLTFIVGGAVGSWNQHENAETARHRNPTLINQIGHFISDQPTAFRTMVGQHVPVQRPENLPLSYQGFDEAGLLAGALLLIRNVKK